MWVVEVVVVSWPKKMGEGGWGVGRDGNFRSMCVCVCVCVCEKERVLITEKKQRY